MPEDLRRSPLDDRHRALEARMAPFAGWEMPIDFGSVVAEHRAVRERVGVFDLTHLGSVSVVGADAAAVVQAALTNDVARLDEGRAQYTLCLTDDGGIVDDLIVYRLPWGYWTVPNAANNDAVVEALQRCADGREAAVVDHGAAVACLAVQGRQSPPVLAKTGVEPGDLAFMGCRPLGVPGDDDSKGPFPDGGGVLARTGYTGERGYELFVPAAAAGGWWDAITSVGATPVGLGARDTLRLEMGYPLHGSDIDRHTNPVEARLLWAVKAGTGFVGEEAVARARAAGPSRRLRGLRATGRGVPRGGCDVRVDDQVVGQCTSGTFGPTAQTGIALAYLAAAVEVGAEAQIDVRGRAVPAEVVSPPFVDRDPKA